MTTWEDNGYRFNLAQLLGRYLKYHRWKNIVEKIDDHLVGGTIDKQVFPSAPNGKVMSETPEYINIFHSKTTVKRPGKEQEIMIDILEKSDKIVIGLQAVYQVFSSLVERDMENLQQVEFDSSLLKFYDHTMRMAGCASYNQEHEYGPFIDSAKHDIAETLNSYGKVHRTVQQLMTMHRERQYRGQKTRWFEGATHPTYGQKLGIRSFQVTHCGGIMLLYTGSSFHTGKVYALDYAAQARLYQVSASFMYIHMYASIYSSTGAKYDIKTPIRRYLSHIVRRMRDSDKVSCQILCKAYKKCYDIFLAILAGKANAPNAKVLVTEYKKSELQKIVELEDVLAICYSVDVKHAMEVARVFKVLPAPDYDMGQSFAELYKKHMNPAPQKPVETPYQPKNARRPVESPTLEGLKLYMRYFWISYHAQVNHATVGTVKEQYRDEAWVSDYMTRAKMPDVVDLSWTLKIDLSNTAAYIEDTDDSILNLKDKVLCYDTLKENLKESGTNRMLTSQVTRLLVDSNKANFLPQRDCNFEHVHRVAPKPEAHKDVARLFFIGNLKGRRTLAELEHNVGWVCRNLPGYAIGKSISEVKTKMHELSTIPPGYAAIFLNTDVEGWSPRMNGDIQQIAMDFWAEVFGRPYLSNYTKIWFGSEIVMNKNGFVSHYTNNKANFEGYNGKVLTYMHLCVIAYATRIARQRQEVVSPANILAFIDDVAARVTVPAAIAAEVTPVYYDSLNEVYEAVGLKLDRFKSILSNHMSVFLNEIYVAGSHLTYGSRATVRLGTIIRAGTDSVIDMIDAARAATEGIIKAGAPHYVAYSLFLVSLAWIHYKWDPGAPLGNTKFAYFQFAPRILGGYGIPTVLTLSSNLASHPVTEGIAILQEIAFMYPDFKDMYRYAITPDIVEKTKVQMLLNPGGAATARMILNNGRVSREVEKALTGFIDDSAIADVLKATTSIKIDEFAEAMIDANTALDAYTLTKFVSATPIDLIRSVGRKFRTSQSIKALIGFKAVNRIAKANRIDVLKVNHKIKKI